MHPTAAAPPPSSRAVLARLPTELPPSLLVRLEDWERTGRPVVAPRASASVVLLRDNDGVLQTFLLHRHARMAFAASMVVFPGGGVDPADGAASVDPVLACALRETAEETGVRLPPEVLHRWAHWTTPVFEPRRYDTTFFVAVVPRDQDAADVSGETTQAEWTAPGDALTAADAGHLGLMPPTRSILLELADARSTADVLDAARGRRVEPVLPKVVHTADGWRFRYPTVRTAAPAAPAEATP